MERNTISLRKIAEDIYPGWELEQWMEWPPNLFALISIVLKKTGSYRVCLMEPTWWDDENWQENIERDADNMLRTTVNLIQANKSDALNYHIKDQIELLKGCWKDFNINNLRTLGDSNKDYENEKCKAVARALVSVLAVVDTCCGFLGFVGQTLENNKKDLKIFKGVANLLLTTTGTLCTFPKFYGTVLPKMRTPQAGIVLRSLSHHLTFHDTEVEVIWRTFPWLHDSKQSLNLMVVPFPKDIDENNFEKVSDKYHSVSYFKGKINEAVDEITGDFLDNLVEVVMESAKSNREVDLLVFPEMSLSEKAYRYLLTKFTTANCQNDCIQLPIIVAGVLHAEPVDKRPKDDQVHNEVRMAVFFNKKWYEITQRKHHRWQLDKSQISQYQFEGCFPTNRNWFEYCSILQRRLTILVPNAWLGLTSLICEDLARQEPVTEVIRGIGPTLLLALLSDGPQIKSRWSARYASVLADDPGTAVLSLTSLGMAKRSRPDDKDHEMDTKKQQSHTVGLWKDMIRGWKEININDDNDVLTFTISAKFKEEYTLDGRSDGINASVFEMDSHNPKAIPFKSKQEKFMSGHQATEHSISKKTEKVVKDGPVTTSPLDSDLFGDWHDIRELSAILFAIDTIVDFISVELDKQKIKSHLNIILPLLMINKSELKGDDFLTHIKNNVSKAWQFPTGIGTSNLPPSTDEIKKKRIDDMTQASYEIRSIVTEFSENRKEEKDFFNLLIQICKQKTDIANPNQRTIALAFLYNIHTKLSNSKFVKELNRHSCSIKPNEAMKLRNQIHDFLSLKKNNAPPA